MSEGKQEAREQPISEDLKRAIYFANKALDEPWSDPDDDLRTVSRQLLRALERAVRQANQPQGAVPFGKSDQQAVMNRALQPQGKAQPESGEMGKEIAYRLNVKPGDALYPPAVALWQAAFQRGQQTMAEKAIAGNPPLPDFLDWLGHRMVKVYLESPYIDFVQACHRRADELRSLASAAPPQGEAEKEGRT